MDDKNTQLLLDMHSTIQVLDERTKVILKQAERADGRVTANELEITRIKSDVSNAKTAFKTLSAVLTVVWAALTFFIPQ